MPKYTNEQVERAKNVDVKKFLEDTENYIFDSNNARYVKCHNPQRTGQPSSLSIDTKLNRIFYNSVTGNRPLSAIDWCLIIKNMDFQSSMQLVLGENPQGERAEKPNHQQHRVQPVMKKTKNLELSERSDNSNNVIAYLTKTRGIPSNIVYDCLNNNLIYQDIRKNAVFVGYDSDNKIPKYATRRGTFTPDGKEPFKRDCTGSDKNFAFRLEGKNTETIYVTEAAIDALSLAALEDKWGGSGAYKEKTYISTGGAGIDNALEQFCKTHNVKTINVCFDNDEAGKNGMEKIMQKFRERGYTVNDMRAGMAHDYNDELVAFNNDPNFYSKPPDVVRAVNKSINERIDIMPEQNISGTNNEQAERLALFRIEKNGEAYSYKTDKTAHELLNISANSNSPFADMMNQGERISDTEYAEIMQSDKFKFSVDVNFDYNSASIYAVNDGKGGIAEADRNDINTAFRTSDLSAFAKSITENVTSLNDDYELDDEPLSLDELVYQASRNESEENVPFDDYSIPDEHYENLHSRYRHEEHTENIPTETTDKMPVNQTERNDTMPEINSQSNPNYDEQSVPYYNEQQVPPYDERPIPPPDEPYYGEQPLPPINEQTVITQSEQSSAVQHPVKKQQTEQTKTENTKSSVIFGNAGYSKIPDKEHIANIEPSISVRLFNRLQQENIQFSGKFTDNGLLVAVSKDNAEKVNTIIREETALLRKKDEQEVTASVTSNVTKEEKKKPEQPDIPAENKTEKADFVSENELLSMSNEQKLNFFLASLKDRQEHKRADLLDKIEKIDSKIADRQERIDKLNNKISDIETSLKTSAALKRAFGNTFISKLIESNIAKKQAKIEQIQNEKIPKQKEKISVQTSKKEKATVKLGNVNRKIDKLDKIQDFFTALGSKDKEERHRGFVAGLENLSDIRRESLENKLHKTETKIDRLSSDYSSPDISNRDRYEIKKSISSLKEKHAAISAKIDGLNKLHNDLDDIKNGKFTESEIETAVNKTADKISERLENANKQGEKGIINNVISTSVESGNEAISEVKAEKSIEQAEKSKSERVPDEREPDVTKDTEQQIMVAVAAVTGIEVSELNRLPVDIKTDIIAEFQQNNGNIPADKLTEKICEIAEIELPKDFKYQEQPLQPQDNKEKEKSLHESDIILKENDNRREASKNEPLFSRSKVMSDDFKPTSEKSQENIEKSKDKKHDMSI